MRKHIRGRERFSVLLTFLFSFGFGTEKLTEAQAAAAPGVSISGYYAALLSPELEQELGYATLICEATSYVVAEEVGINGNTENKIGLLIDCMGRSPFEEDQTSSSLADVPMLRLDLQACYNVSGTAKMVTRDCRPVKDPDGIDCGWRVVFWSSTVASGLVGPQSAAPFRAIMPNDYLGFEVQIPVAGAPQNGMIALERLTRSEDIQDALSFWRKIKDLWRIFFVEPTPEPKPAKQPMPPAQAMPPAPPLPPPPAFPAPPVPAMSMQLPVPGTQPVLGTAPFV